jgi:hypothetical protein
MLLRGGRMHVGGSTAIQYQPVFSAPSNLLRVDYRERWKMLNDLDQDRSEHIERWFDMGVGPTVYGLASAAAGIMDLIWGDFDGAHQPIQAFGDHIPGSEILA